jgi:cytoskeleton protein RodZ
MSPPDADTTELNASPGARLRREREARGMSEQLAAETLNLDPSILACLESNDFAALGAPVFVKGHLRRYAALLGLGEDEIVALYDRSKQQVGEPSLVPRSRLEMAPVRGDSRWPWVVGGMAAFLVAAGLAAYVSENGLPGQEPEAYEQPAQVLQQVPATSADSGLAAANPTIGAARPAPVAQPDGGVQTAVAATPGSAPFTSSTASGAGSAAATAPPATAPPATAPGSLQPGQVSLQLSFSVDSWVEVFDGSGKAVLYDLGKAGSVRTITANAPLSVTLGNAGGVAVTVNGRRLPAPPRAAGQALARFGIGPDGSLR